MGSQEIKSHKNIAGNEVNLIDATKKLWSERSTIIYTIVVFFILGFIIAVFSKKEYTASTIMVPQTSDSGAKIGGLSSLASLAGFNLNMNSGYEISPVLYPQIVSSVQFQLELMDTKYEFEGIDDKISLFEYYINFYRPGLLGIIKKYTIGLPGVILKSAKEESKSATDNRNHLSAIVITKDQERVRKIIDENLNLSINDKDGYLTLTSSFPQPVLAAQVAKKAQELLQEYITRLKIEKATSQLSFIEERYEETQKEFRIAQTKLAVFRDANKNIISAVAQTELEKLENEYQLSFEVYSELAKQLEQARIKVKEETPVFSVIEEVVIPIKKSKPNRLLIVILWVFFGLLMGIGIISGRVLINSFKEQW